MDAASRFGGEGENMFDFAMYETVKIVGTIVLIGALFLGASEGYELKTKQ